PGKIKRSDSTLKGLGVCGNNPFRVQMIVVVVFPGLSLRSNTGLKLANAFGVDSIFEFAFVHHLGHFELAVDFDCLPNLQHKLKLTTAGLDKWLSINYSWKHKLRAEAVLSRRAEVSQKHSRTIFALEVGTLL